MITDVFVSTITLVYFAMKLENNGKYHEVKTHESLELKSMNKAEIPPEEDMQEVVAVKKQESSVYFHLLMMVFGFNLAMIMTNWGLVTGWTSYTSFGIRITQATMTLILFF